jgi:cytochrome c biogenesis protein CcmG/thiol:disulfide interchange protein DsbE
MKLAIPLVAFLGLTTALTAGLRLDPRLVPSPLIDRPAPAFRLDELRDAPRTFGPSDARGGVWLLNVWASWCVSCRAEHALLTALSQTGVAPIYGLDYKDTRAEALAFLDAYGDPYVLSVQDVDGRTAIDYGVYGVPETFLIDRDGVIRFKQIGPLTPDVIEQTIMPMVGRLGR